MPPGCGQALQRIQIRLLKCVRAEQSGNCLYIGSWNAVFIEMRDGAADGRMGAGYVRAGLQREAVVEALCRAHHFDRQDELKIAGNLGELESTSHPHGDVVFFAAGGGYGVCARWMGEDFAFVQERGGRDVGDHVPA